MAEKKIRIHGDARARFPRIEHTYIEKGTTNIVTVLAIGVAHVVCDLERIYEKKDFAKRFLEIEIGSRCPA